MKFKILLLAVIFSSFSLISTQSFAQTDASKPILSKEQKTLENQNQKEDRISVESQRNKKMQKTADASEKEYELKAKEAKRNKNEADHAAKEARRVNNEASDAARQAKRSAKMEKSAQNSRAKAEAQREKADKAARKSDKN